MLDKVISLYHNKMNLSRPAKIISLYHTKYRNWIYYDQMLDKVISLYHNQMNLPWPVKIIPLLFYFIIQNVRIEFTCTTTTCQTNKFCRKNNWIITFFFNFYEIYKLNSWNIVNIKYMVFQNLKMWQNISCFKENF